jgi:hypothetical protein
MATNRRQSIRDILWGNADYCSLENRVFNAVSFLVTLCTVVAAATDVVLDNPPLQILGAIGAFALALTAYLLSRVLKIYSFINITGIVAFLFFISLIWFSSGGVAGSMSYSLFILMVATVITVPHEKKRYVVSLNFFVFLILFLLENLHPSWVVHYFSPKQQVIDMTIFLFMSLLIVSTMVYVVFQQYVREKEKKEKLLDQVIEDKEKIEKAFSEIKLLQGIIPICSECKKVRNDKGYWEQVEDYVRNRSEAQFTHGFCPECLKKLYGIEVPKE